MVGHPPGSTLFPYTTLFRSVAVRTVVVERGRVAEAAVAVQGQSAVRGAAHQYCSQRIRSEEHTSELQSHSDLVCRLLLGNEITVVCHRRAGSAGRVVHRSDR